MTATTMILDHDNDFFATIEEAKERKQQAAPHEDYTLYYFGDFGYMWISSGSVSRASLPSAIYTHAQNLPDTLIRLLLHVLNEGQPFNQPIYRLLTNIKDDGLMAGSTNGRLILISRYSPALFTLTGCEPATVLANVGQRIDTSTQNEYTRLPGVGTRVKVRRASSSRYYPGTVVAAEPNGTKIVVQTDDDGTLLSYSDRVLLFDPKNGPYILPLHESTPNLAHVIWEYLHQRKFNKKPSRIELCRALAQGIQNGEIRGVRWEGDQP